MATKEIREHEKIKKPIKPIRPNYNDKKYEAEHNERRWLGLKSGEGKDSQFIIDYKQWQKHQAAYDKEIILYEQYKMIEDIKRSSLSNCFKKYTISKK